MMRRASRAITTALCLGLWLAAAAAPAGIAVTLGDGAADVVGLADETNLGRIGSKGGSIQYVSVVTGEPQEVTYRLGLPACVSVIPVLLESPVAITPRDTDARVTFEPDAIRIDNLTIPWTGSVEVRFNQLVITGHDTAACCTRATVVDAAGASVKSTPADNAETPCGGGYSGFFIHDARKPAPASE